MQSKLIALVALGTAVFAAPDLRRRQATDPAQFSSAVSQLIGIYIPSSVAPIVESAIASAAAESGITGDITSIINSGLAQTSPPNYLTAVPTVYEDNFASLESAIEELRGVASTGIPGAPKIITDPEGNVVTSTLNAIATTDSLGATIIGVTGPVTDAGGSVVPSVTSTIATSVTETTAPSPANSLTSGAVTTTDSAGATIVGLVAVTTDSAGSSLTSITSTLPLLSSSTDTASSASTTTASTTTTRTSTSSASAASPTTSGAGVPAAVAQPGAAGLVGMVMLLLQFLMY